MDEIERIEFLEGEIPKIWAKVNELEKTISQGFISEPIESEPSDDDQRQGLKEV